MNADQAPVSTDKRYWTRFLGQDTAFYVGAEQIARAIQRALLDEDLRGELIAKGKAQAARYSWDRTAREVLEVYREVSVSRH